MHHTNEFESEKKFCPTCDTYVRYLMSVDHSYCIECGGRVRLFSKQDSEQFAENLEKRKWKAS